jgi:hypothetical protein
MDIELLRPEHVPFVTALNQRLRAGGVAHQLGTDPDPPALGDRIVHENYVAVDGDFVRGGYTLIWQYASVGGQLRRLAFLQIPLSEGIVERKYASLGLLLLKDAMRRAPGAAPPYRTEAVIEAMTLIAGFAKQNPRQGV